MRYYPIYLDLKDRLCVVVGGGEVAERKVRSLLDSQARVRVISPRLNSGLEGLRRESRIAHRPKEFEEGDLEGAFLVIGATDDSRVNSHVGVRARERGALVNLVDDAEGSDFIAPSVVVRGDLVLSISTGGKSPALARQIRQELEVRYGPEYAVFLELMGELRKEIIELFPDPARREKVFLSLVRSNILQWIARGDNSLAREEARSILMRNLEHEGVEANEYRPL